MANIIEHDEKLMNESTGDVIDSIIIEREVFMLIVKPKNYVIHFKKVSNSLHRIDILDTWTS